MTAPVPAPRPARQPAPWRDALGIALVLGIVAAVGAGFALPWLDRFGKPMLYAVYAAVLAGGPAGVKGRA